MAKHASETAGQGHYGGFAASVVFTVAAIFSIFYWVLGALFIYVFSAITALFMKSDAHRNLGHRTLGCLFRGFFHVLVWMRAVKIEDEVLQSVCDMEGPLIVASNHPSLWDAPLLIRRFVTVSCIMKAEIANNPILLGGSRFAGFVPNRPKLDMVRTANRYLDNGGRLLLFPEGTRTRDASKIINPFRPGLALLSRSADCPILPVFLHMNSAYMEKGWPAWKMPPMPIVVTVEVGELQHPEAGENTHQYSARLEKYFRQELRRRFPK